MSDRRPLGSIKDKIPALVRKPQEAIRGTKDRSWEYRARHDPETRQVTFRGIPRPAYDRMKEIAVDHDITVSEVARLLLESALEDYEAGMLEFVTEGRGK